MNQELRFIECTSPSCRFRFPSDGDLLRVHYCPKCGSRTKLYSYKHPNVSKPSPLLFNWLHREYVAVLDNIRSIYNVGSIFRTSDGFGIDKLFLCGITSTPANIKFHKTSLGSESNLKWEYHNNCVLLCQSLIDEGYLLICLENDNSAIDINNFSLREDDKKVAVIVGNEKAGIDPEILTISHQAISIPMAGIKESFNVSVAFGIMLYHLMSSW